jgi:hypothetical protein
MLTCSMDTALWPYNGILSLCCAVLSNLKQHIKAAMQLSRYILRLY